MPGNTIFELARIIADEYYPEYTVRAAIKIIRPVLYAIQNRIEETGECKLHGWGRFWIYTPKARNLYHGWGPDKGKVIYRRPKPQIKFTPSDKFFRSVFPNWEERRSIERE